MNFLKKIIEKINNYIDQQIEEHKNYVERGEK
jgi:hypothetical protein